MPRRYASGTKSKAICDRCGFKYPYLSLMLEWKKKLVCPECFDIKPPQQEPRTSD